MIEAYMQQALVTKEQELEATAAAFMNDPANAEALADEKLWEVTIGDGLENIPV
jgi:hypothetical protein